MTEKAEKKTFHSFGKLLITAEYVVLDGAEALAVPTVKGQSLEIANTIAPDVFLEWQSFDHLKNPWLEVNFDEQLQVLFTNNAEKASTLQRLLMHARKMNPVFLNHPCKAVAYLEFPINWGLGSSSTLVNNIADWAEIDAFQLQFEVFGGSGYDIACARNDVPILYCLKQGKPVVKRTAFEPPFKEELFFVYLGEKQNSRKEISRYRAFSGKNRIGIDAVNTLTRQIIDCRSRADFEVLMVEHEQTISKLIGMKPIREERFSDYSGVIKSLGAWGGDFVLSAGLENRNYFKKKGLHTILTYTEMVRS